MRLVFARNCSIAYSAVAPKPALTPDGNIHGQEMPDLAELKAAGPKQIAITYTEVKGGAEFSYKTSDARLVQLCTSGLMPRFRTMAQTWCKGMTTAGKAA